jgi:hypothetical protein
MGRQKHRGAGQADEVNNHALYCSCRLVYHPIAGDALSLALLVSSQAALPGYYIPHDNVSK